MVAASQLRAGMAIRFEGQLYKVLLADYHPGQGQMGGVAHTRLKNLSTGTLREHSFRADLKLDEVEIQKVQADFLYVDSGYCTFMDPGTFEQLVVPAYVIGPQAALLQSGMRVCVELVEGTPVSAVFPDILEVRVADTAPPVHQQTESVWKLARLENGVEIMVPQFVKAGDLIRLDTGSMKYMDRARGMAKG